MPAIVVVDAGNHLRCFGVYIDVRWTNRSGNTPATRIPHGSSARLPAVGRLLAAG